MRLCLPLARIAPGDSRTKLFGFFGPAAQGAALGRLLTCFERRTK